MTFAVVVSAVALTATWPPAVIVHLLPLVSVIDPVVPFTTVSFGEAVGVGVGAGVGVGVGAGVGVGVGAGMGVGVAGSGLVAVPAAGAHEAFGVVSPHHRLLLFSCQIVPLT